MSLLASSFQVSQFVRNHISGFEAEEFWVMALDKNCMLLDARKLFQGTLDACPIHPRDIFRFGILSNATWLVVSHTHPSGACRPSFADIRLTRELKEAGDLLRMPLMDHVIVCRNSYFSFADRIWNRKK